jgi:hypothetical protein
MNPAPQAFEPVARLLDLARPGLPRATAQAETALREALGGIRASSWPEVAWCFSRINGDGFPIEFTFSSAQPELRYTTEIAPPEVSEQDRWQYAWRWAGGPAFGSPPTSLVSGCQSGNLRWGAWVGGSHSESQDRRKVYLEASTNTATQTFRDVPIVPGAELRFVGIDSAGTNPEFYFRRDCLAPADVGRVLWQLGWGGCFTPICEAISATVPWPTNEYLLPTSSGFSIAPARALTVYTYARCLWGSDASIRHHALELATKNSWDFRLYDAVTKPLEHRDSYLTYHGILAWIVAPGRPVEVRISVRPPC